MVRSLVVLVVLAGILGSKASAQQSLYACGHPASTDKGGVFEYDAQTGGLRAFVEVKQAVDVTIGPDDNLYISSQNGDDTYRLDLSTRQLSVFSTEGIVGIFSLAFGPDGDLFASSASPGSARKVARYDGSSGGLLGTFVPGPVPSPVASGLAFDGLGTGFVGEYDQIWKYDATGQLVDVFSDVPVAAANGIAISPSGSIVVAGTGAGVYELDSSNGSLVRTFPQGPGAVDLAFGPEDDLFVSSNSGTDGIRRYDWETAQFLGNFVDGSIDLTFCGLAFGPSAAVLDRDLDGVDDSIDNCPDDANAEQTDTDGDGTGDACNDLEDPDGDELAAPYDNCPTAFNPTQVDSDSDTPGDACDNCPKWPNQSQQDVDKNGIGDPCECGDQNENGAVNVTDIVSINAAIFGRVQVSPLCDTNFDARCDVQDIVGANQKIFGRPAYCSRYPPPPQ